VSAGPAIAPALSGRTVVVLGAGGALGRACADEAQALGATVIGCAREPARLAPRFGAEGSRALDLTQPASFAAWAASLPELDGVVFASGISFVQPANLLAPSKLAEILEVNVEGPLLVVKELLRARRLRRGAAVVLLGSVAARRGSVGYTAYAASKGALAAAVRPLALEVATLGIRVNVVEPGLIESEMASRARAMESAAETAAYASRYPLGPGRPTDVAGAVAFLLGPSSRWITGTSIVVDGGMMAR
jgi:NAD(P)-dependent dehydrogenase (short-subunit alcohol dehydrogenase family)